MRSLEIKIHWTPVESEHGVPWTFPNHISAYMQDHYSRPAVYRWCVGMPLQAEPKLIYIGEANSLTERIRKVLSPSRVSRSRDTNQRLNTIFKGELSNGNLVTLNTCSFDDFSFNDIVYSESDMSLWHKFKRCALENLLLCSYLHWEERLLNVRIEPYEHIEKRLINSGIRKNIVRKMNVKKVLQDLE